MPQRRPIFARSPVVRVPSPRAPAWIWMLLPMIASAAVRDLWAPDEPRYAQVAREITTRGEWLILHLCDDVYPIKPPLLYWINAVLGQLGGWEEFWLRVPSLIATAVSAWLTGKLALRWWGWRAAEWAPVLYLTTVMVTEIGGRLQLDPFFSALCLGSTWLLIESDGNAGRRRIAAGVFTALAILTKGPVAFVHVVVATLALSEREQRSVVGWRQWTSFVVIALAPALAWVAYVVYHEPQTARELLFAQHVGRIVNPGAGHLGPPWKNLLRVPLLALPWTPLVLAGIVAAWRSRLAPAGTGDRRLAGVLVWFATVFVFFSVLPEKRDLYLLPVYPAIAMLGAWMLDESMRRGHLSAWVGLPGPLLMVVLGIGVVIAPFVMPGVALASEHLRASVAGLALVAAGAVAVLVYDEPGPWARRLSIGWAAAATVVALAVLPAVNPSKSARELGMWLARRPERPAAIATVGVQPEGYRYYGGLPTVRGRFDELLESEGPEFLALVRLRVWDTWSEERRASLSVLRRQTVGGRTVVVVGAGKDAAGSLPLLGSD